MSRAQDAQERPHPNLLPQREKELLRVLALTLFPSRYAARPCLCQTIGFVLISGAIPCVASDCSSLSPSGSASAAPRAPRIAAARSESEWIAGVTYSVSSIRKKFALPRAC